MKRAKTKTPFNSNCINCTEERKKADQSRKYAHELKNIFITISTVVNSEIENAKPSRFSLISDNTSHFGESGDVSPFIMEHRKQIGQTKANNNANNINCDSSFFFLKTLCDYGKTLIKELNNLGKDFINDSDEIEPFNISKAIDFCVDMFDTKRKYDKTKRNLQIYSDINFSYDKVIKSINETGFKIVLINLLTNSYKFTVKGKIIVRAVSIPKEKKIRIMVKDTGKGFDPNKFKKNGCFYVYEKNQELNVDGSGLGLSIVNEILTKFKIKLDFFSDPEKGGSLFYFDLEDIFPYYDEIYPKRLMTEALSKIIKDINMGKKDVEIHNSRPSFNYKDSLINVNKNLNDIHHKKISEKEINITSNENINKVNNHINNNDLNIQFNNDDEQRFSFVMSGDLGSTPKFNDGYNKNNRNKLTNSKNLNVNIYNLNNATLFSFDKESIKNKKSSDANNESNNNNIFDNNRKKINSRKNSSENQKRCSKENNKIRKLSKTNMLKHIIEESTNFQKIRISNNAAKKGRETQIDKQKSKIKTLFGDIETNTNEIEEINDLNNEIIKIKKIKEGNNKNKKNFKKLLDKNFNKTEFYLLDLKKMFLKNEIYIHLTYFKNNKCITVPSSKNNSPKKLKKKKSFYNDNYKVYIIICDDEEFVARSAREMIINYYTKKGKEPHVYYTPNGIECIYLMYKLSIIENKHIEYILMDKEMPYLNGIDTCNIIKSIKEARVPRIFILSGDEPSECEADGYCNKPLSEIDIINKLDCNDKDM